MLGCEAIATRLKTAFFLDSCTGGPYNSLIYLNRLEIMSFFITFEGIEGCGKTTQMDLLRQRFEAQGQPVVCTREPGGCPIANSIRQILLHPGNSTLVPMAELLLYAAARAQHVEEIIRPALQSGKAVLCDRYVDATIVYQGAGRGLSQVTIGKLNEFATDGLWPDLTILLDMPAQAGLERARARNHNNQNGLDEDRFEREALSFHETIRQGYLDQAASAPHRFRIIDARGSQDEVHARIAAAIDAFLVSSSGGHDL